MTVCTLLRPVNLTVGVVLLSVVATEKRTSLFYDCWYIVEVAQRPK